MLSLTPTISADFEYLFGRTSGTEIEKLIFIWEVGSLFDPRLKKRTPPVDDRHDESTRPFVKTFTDKRALFLALEGLDETNILIVPVQTYRSYIFSDLILKALETRARKGALLPCPQPYVFIETQLGRSITGRLRQFRQPSFWLQVRYVLMRNIKAKLKVSTQSYLDFVISPYSLSEVAKSPYLDQFFVGVKTKYYAVRRTNRIMSEHTRSAMSRESPILILSSGHPLHLDKIMPWNPRNHAETEQKDWARYKSQIERLTEDVAQIFQRRTILTMHPRVWRDAVGALTSKIESFGTTEEMYSRCAFIVAEFGSTTIDDAVARQIPVAVIDLGMVKARAAKRVFRKEYSHLGVPIWSIDDYSTWVEPRVGPQVSEPAALPSVLDVLTALLAEP